MCAEGNPEPLHFWNQLGRAVSLGAVENHVFKKVSEALLVIALHQGSCSDVKAQRHPFGRLGIWVNDVAEPVVQNSVCCVWVWCDVGVCLWPWPRGDLDYGRNHFWLG